MGMVGDMAMGGSLCGVLRCDGHVRKGVWAQSKRGGKDEGE